MTGVDQFVAARSVLHDITELHARTLALEKLNAEQGVVLNNDLISIVRLRDRKVVWANRAFDRIFGYHPGEMLGQSTAALFLDDEAFEAFARDAYPSLREGKTYRAQLRLRRKDGSIVWTDCSGSMLDPDTSEIMWFALDISEQRKAEELRVRSAELEAENRQLRETQRLHRLLLANMSHELRTPLNAILAFGQMLESGSVKSDSPKYVGYISRIVGSGKHLLGLIDQVLDYAKVESGKMTFDPAPTRVPHELHEVVEMLQPESAARRIAVLVSVDDSVESVITDPLRLKQMLLALVGNAIKFSHEGGSVDLRASVVDDAFWQVDITDRGIGIDEANLARLFSPFVQLSSGSTKTHGGTGIGLALVRLIAQAQGGRIDVRSQLGAGSTFSLILPRALGKEAGAAE